MLEKKADVNQTDESTGNTPLITSIGHDTFDIFKEILNHHPNVNARNKSGETALYCIVVNQKIDNNRLKYLEELINYQPPDISDSKTKKKRAENLPCDMKMRYQQGKTILHIAVENEKRDKGIINTIIEKSGLDIDVEDDNGNTPLHIAAQKEYELGIKMFIDLGCDPTQPNKTGRTAFSMVNPSIAPNMTIWMNDPEATQKREERRKEKLKSEKDEEKERIEKRDEKLQRSPPNQKPESAESPSKVSKNKRSMLLAMTLGNGTLRNSQSGADSLAKSKKIKRIEARPWGGSKDTAMFQRDIRIKLRQMKSEVNKELDEIKKSIHELRKTAGISDDEELENNTETDANSLSESPNTSHSQINNDNDILDANNNSNEQNQSFGDDQFENQIKVEDEMSQNSQVNANLSAGHEEEPNSENIIVDENKVEDEMKDKNDDSELNNILNDDSNIAEHDSNNAEHSSFDIDNLD